MSKKKLRRGPDTRSIDIDDEHQLDYWARELGVPREKVRTAALSVGGYIQDVKRYIMYVHNVEKAH